MRRERTIGPALAPRRPERDLEHSGSENREDQQKRRGTIQGWIREANTSERELRRTG
jgi:hypothetical protein